MIWEMAGIAGVEPGPLTLRQLIWMAEARQRATWNQTSSVLAMMANVNRDPKKTRAFRADQFNPYASRRSRGVPIDADNIHLLKALLAKGRKGNGTP